MIDFPKSMLDKLPMFICKKLTKKQLLKLAEIIKKACGDTQVDKRS